MKRHFSIVAEFKSQVCGRTHVCPNELHYIRDSKRFRNEWTCIPYAFQIVLKVEASIGSKQNSKYLPPPLLSCEQKLHMLSRSIAIRKPFMTSFEVLGVFAHSACLSTP
jgi:hypothetical protein